MLAYERIPNLATFLTVPGQGAENQFFAHRTPEYVACRWSDMVQFEQWGRLTNNEFDVHREAKADAIEWAVTKMCLVDTPAASAAMAANVLTGSILVGPSITLISIFSLFGTCYGFSDLTSVTTAASQSTPQAEQHCGRNCFRSTNDTMS